MAKYRVDTDKGSYIVETESSPIAQTQPSGIAPNIAKLGERGLSAADFMPSEQRMMNRPSAIKDLIQDPSTLERFQKHPLGTSLRTLAGAGQLMEGVPASIGVDIQNRNFAKIPKHILDTFTGQRVAQFGDILKGGGYPEPVAATGGFVASLGLGGVNPKSAIKFPGQKLGEAAGRNIGIAGKVEQAVKPIVAKPINPFKNVYKYSKPQNRMTLVNEVRDNYIKFKRDLTDIFGGEYEKIIGESDKRINLMKPVQEWFEDHGSNVLNSEEFRNAFKTGDPTANKIYKIINGIINPKTKVNINDISAQEADSLRKWIENLPGIRSKLKLSYSKGKGIIDFTNNERILLDLANNIKSEIIDNHPMLGGLNDFYRQGKESINLFRSGILGNNLDSTLGNIRSFNQKENFDFARKAAEQILDKKTLSKVQEFSKADAMANLLKKIGGITAVGGAGVVGGALYQHFSK